MKYSHRVRELALGVLPNGENHVALARLGYISTIVKTVARRHSQTDGPVSINHMGRDDIQWFTYLRSAQRLTTASLLRDPQREPHRPNLITVTFSPEETNSRERALYGDELAKVSIQGDALLKALGVQQYELPIDMVEIDRHITTVQFAPWGRYGSVTATLYAAGNSVISPERIVHHGPSGNLFGALLSKDVDRTQAVDGLTEFHLLTDDVQSIGNYSDRYSTWLGVKLLDGYVHMLGQSQTVFGEAPDSSSQMVHRAELTLAQEIPVSAFNAKTLLGAVCAELEMAYDMDG